MRKEKYLYLALFFGFLLGIHDGFIALWRTDSPQPAEVFPYRADSLPIADQEALKKGIPVESAQDLAHLLEDYLS